MTTFSNTAIKIMMVALAFIFAGACVIVAYLFNMETQSILNIGASIVGFGCLLGFLSVAVA